jgi:hypothetical protein
MEAEGRMDSGTRKIGRLTRAKAKAKAKAFNAAEYLDSPEAVAAYLSDAFKTGDDDFIAQAIGTVARAGSAKLRAPAIAAAASRLLIILYLKRAPYKFACAPFWSAI